MYSIPAGYLYTNTYTLLCSYNMYIIFYIYVIMENKTVREKKMDFEEISYSDWNNSPRRFFFFLFLKLDTVTRGEKSASSTPLCADDCRECQLPPRSAT